MSRPVCFVLSIQNHLNRRATVSSGEKERERTRHMYPWNTKNWVRHIKNIICLHRFVIYLLRLRFVFEKHNSIFGSVSIALGVCSGLLHSLSHFGPNWSFYMLCALFAWTNLSAFISSTCTWASFSYLPIWPIILISI